MKCALAMLVLWNSSLAIAGINLTYETIRLFPIDQVATGDGKRVQVRSVGFNRKRTKIRYNRRRSVCKEISQQDWEGIHRMRHNTMKIRVRGGQSNNGSAIYLGDNLFLTAHHVMESPERCQKTTVTLPNYRSMFSGMPQQSRSNQYEGDDIRFPCKQVHVCVDHLDYCILEVFAAPQGEAKDLIRPLPLSMVKYGNLKEVFNLGNADGRGMYASAAEGFYSQERIAKPIPYPSGDRVYRGHILVHFAGTVPGMSGGGNYLRSDAGEYYLNSMNIVVTGDEVGDGEGIMTGALPMFQLRDSLKALGQERPLQAINRLFPKIDVEFPDRAPFALGRFDK